MATTVSRTPEQKKAALTTARILLEIKAINFRPEEPYILTSGWASPVYVDCRKVISFPRARTKISELMSNAILREVGYESTEAVAGGETAGIPYAAWISDRLNLPMLYIRKKPKGFGRNAQIEGDFKDGDRVVLVEDLASDGASKVNFVNALRQAGAKVDHSFVVFFYGVFPGALKSLEEIGVSMGYLCNWWDVLEVVEQEGQFDKRAIEEVRSFLHDPVQWSSLHGGRSA
ncbi:orotate phosphoribosyltransferase [Paramagnetospirillum caucaseum]|uniref:Orotate phosphoribosyltransferase n=1 Tax=Paramagnetospirillum caucaseum TaxID=1244869 RepID=M2Z615_9PROT|nr:orotate phosphoribosyltransferase [Paramagnetospirillum caucaseum]EME69765.1 orotate phosphoribosyltransferase [Paramagnetospirillum caucaseum]